MIDEKAIWEWLGYKIWQGYVTLPDKTLGVMEIHSLDVQAKYLWPKLVREYPLQLTDVGPEWWALLGRENETRYEGYHMKPATAVLFAVQNLLEVIKK